MLESLIFMLLMFIGIISLIISLLVIVIGLIKKSKRLKKIGLVIGMAPIACYALIAFWYKVAIPSFNNSQMKDFAGTYAPHESAKSLLIENGINEYHQRLILNSNGTFQFDSIPGVSLNKLGKWQTGGIDGLFEFHDENGNLIEWASPSGGGEDSALSFEFNLNKDDWKNTERILLVKIK